MLSTLPPPCVRPLIPGTQRRSASLTTGILVADDEPIICELAACFFEHEKIPYWLASDGWEALNVFQQHRTDIAIVLLDIHLPYLNGAQTVQHLKRLKPNLVTYLMSGDWNPYTKKELHQMGVTDLLLKPFSFKLFIPTVRQHLKMIANGADQGTTA